MNTVPTSQLYSLTSVRTPVLNLTRRLKDAETQCALFTDSAGPPHVRQFQPNTTWTFILPHHDIPMNATLTIVHAETVNAVEFILHWHHDSRPSHLLVPKTQLLTPVQIPEPVRLLFKHLELRCLESLHWPPLLGQSPIFWDTCQHNMMYPPVRVAAQNILCDYSDHPCTWAVIEVDMKLRVGQFIYLVEGEVPGIHIREAKIVGIHALELDWVEFIVQMHPKRIRQIHAEFAYLAIPLTHAELDRILLMKYEGTKQYLNNECAASCIAHPLPFIKSTRRIRSRL
ncbi:hypothetical protein NM688_g3402 [Phlebia brevispora]|uniref:Uncharacterized protein n=1 Tax=Phlebia brevispora TaxID=194682 RepID=A0ACC1T5X6_9APHY|nr:hypothetical protein NM688_g3402 [Phlebia brevispora]